MRKTYAVIKDDKVENMAVAEYPVEPNWVESATAQIGDRYVNGSFIAAPPKPRETPKIDLNSLTEAEKQSLINLVRVRP